MSAFPVLATGCKAFVDSFAGLLPCVVTAIVEEPASPGPQFCLRSGGATSRQQVTVRLTADHGPYRKGEVLTQSAIWVVPPRALHRRAYRTTVGFYAVQPDRSSP